MSISIKQIQYFMATAESGKVSQAAINLNVSQSAVTTAIKTLEQQVETALFERRANGMTLTYEGNQFMQHARDIVASVQEATRLTTKRRSEIKGTLNLAMTSTVAGYFIPNHLMRFQNSFPNIKVLPFETERPLIEEGLISGQFDLAVMLTSNLENQEQVTHKTLLRSPRRLWTSADHKFMKFTTVSLQDVSNEPYLVLTIDEASVTTQRYWARTAYRPNIVFRSLNVEAIRSMVANGTGVTILSDMVYRPWSLEGRRIEAISLNDTVPTMDVGVVWKQDMEISPCANALIEFIQLAVRGIADFSHSSTM